MSFLKGKSGLKIKKTTQNISVEVENIKEWRDNLPMSDISLTSRSIYEAVIDIVDKDSVPEKKFKSLEILRPVVQHVCLELRKHFTNNYKPLNEMQLQVIELCYMLQLEMVNGYKQVVEKLYEEKGNSILAASIHRALYFYELILLRTGILYQRQPESLWEEIHTLYKVAEKTQTLTKDFHSDNISVIMPKTVEKMYFSCALLYVIDQYRWRHSEIQTLQTVLHLWVDYLEISKGKKEDKNTPGKFLIELDTDYPPRICAKFTEEEIVKNKVLNLSKLIEHLKELSDKLKLSNMEELIKNNTNIEYRLSEYMVKKLIKAWENNQVRKEERELAEDEVEILIGLQDCHFRINNKQDLNVTEDEEDEDSGIGMALPSFEIEGDEEETSDEETEEEREVVSNSNFVHHSYEGVLYDKSKQGYCLLWKGPKNPPVQSGEIIAIRNKEDSVSTWAVGMIVWMKNKEKGLMIGVQILSPYAVAAGVQPIRENQNSGYFLKCLILPSSPNLGINESTIITPTVPFKEQTKASLIFSNNGKSVSIELLKEVACTGTYKQFEFFIDKTETAKRMERKKKAKEKKMQKQTGSTVNIFSPEKSESFNSLWDKL